MSSAAKRVAVLVGTSQGIGLELARIYLSQSNLHIVALSRNSKAAREAILDSSRSHSPLIVAKDKSAGHTSDSAFKEFKAKEGSPFDESRLTTIDTDVKDEESIHKASEQVKSQFGKDTVRLIFNVAGMVRTKDNRMGKSHTEHASSCTQRRALLRSSMARC
jgi:NAD(P)-dependent dehydrogenase (short-subunit alcohol dehydrogenase family)